MEKADPSFTSRARNSIDRTTLAIGSEGSFKDRGGNEDKNKKEVQDIIFEIKKV